MMTINELLLKIISDIKNNNINFKKIDFHIDAQGDELKLENWWFKDFLNSIYLKKETGDVEFEWNSTDQASSVYSFLANLNDEFDLGWQIDSGYAELTIPKYNIEAFICDESSVYEVRLLPAVRDEEE